MKPADLERRNQDERAFHEQKFGAVIAAGGTGKSYYEAGFTRPVVQRMFSRLGDVRGLTILEFGCGEGWVSRNLARRGATLQAFDISHSALRLARSHGSRPEDRRVSYAQMSAERLAYRDGAFDAVIGSAILHHLDLERALAEIHRVLRPGGRALFSEPLGHNPLLNLYRRLTPGARSRDETPLRLEHFDLFKRFAKVEHEEFFLTALAALPFHALRLDGAMIRARDLLLGLDRRLAARFPGLWKYHWYTLLELEK